MYKIVFHQLFSELHQHDLMVTLLQGNFEEDRMEATEVVPLSSLAQVHISQKHNFFLKLNFTQEAEVEV